MKQYLLNKIRHEMKILRRPFSQGLFKRRGAVKTGKSVNNQNGFTLVELLVAITLMVIGVLAVIGMQTVALQSNSIANQLSVATSLASEALEDISSDAWYNNGIGLTNDSITLKFDGTSNAYGNYSYQGKGLYTISCFPYANNPITDIVKLDIFVTYTYKGNEKRVTMSGYSYKRAI